MGLKQVLAMSALPLVGGCGLQVPDIGRAPGPAMDQLMTEIDLINHIKCEIYLGAREALKAHGAKPSIDSRGVGWLRGWEAKLSLKMSVDDTTSLNPGVTINDPMKNVISYFSTGAVTSPQSFSATFGLQASAQSTRTETIALTYLIADLLDHHPLPKNAATCDDFGRVPILNNLKIQDFIVAQSGVAADAGVAPNDGFHAPFSAFSYQSTFIVTTGGSATPIWKLVHVTANASSPLFNAVRKRTQDISITMGKIGDGDAASVYQASLFGQSISNSLQNRGEGR